MTAPTPSAAEPHRVPIGPDGIDENGRPTYGGLRKWQPSQPPAARDAGVGELLPCLFCGSIDGPDLVGSWAGGPPRHYVSCDTCDAAGPSGATEADAIATWNRRAPLAPAAVDAGTGSLAYWRNMAESETAAAREARPVIGECIEYLDLAEGDGARPDLLRVQLLIERIPTLADALTAACDAIATAAQPARAVPAGMVMVGAEALEALLRKLPGDDEGWGNLDYDDIIVAACDLAKTAIIHPAPADASEAVRDGE